MPSLFLSGDDQDRWLSGRHDEVLKEGRVSRTKQKTDEDKGTKKFSNGGRSVRIQEIGNAGKGMCKQATVIVTAMKKRKIYQARL
jgi:hypothetical protein